MKNRLKTKYEQVCKEYVELFCKKQDMEYNGWVGGIVGGVAYCNDFFFNMRDIIWDINTEQPKGLIIEWYYNNIDDASKSINYYHYTKGLRKEDVNKGNVYE